MTVDNQKFEEALKNRNFEEAMTMLADGSINQERESARLRKNKYQEIRENRQQRVNDLAMTYEGFGKNWNTGYLAFQSIVGAGASRMFGLTAGQSALQSIGAFKSVRDAGVQGTQTSLNSAIEEMKRIQDDLKGDDQRSSSAISEFMNQIKQLHQMMHEASPQMSRSH